jgi:hypothetical protein
MMRAGNHDPDLKAVQRPTMDSGSAIEPSGMTADRSLDLQAMADAILLEWTEPADVSTVDVVELYVKYGDADWAVLTTVSPLGGTNNAGQFADPFWDGVAVKYRARFRFLDATFSAYTTSESVFVGAVVTNESGSYDDVEDKLELTWTDPAATIIAEGLTYTLAHVGVYHSYDDTTYALSETVSPGVGAYVEYGPAPGDNFYRPIAIYHAPGGADRYSRLTIGATYVFVSEPSRPEPPPPE